MDDQGADRDRQIMMLVSFHPEMFMSVRPLAPNSTGKCSEISPRWIPAPVRNLTVPKLRFAKCFIAFNIKCTAPNVRLLNVITLNNSSRCVLGLLVMSPHCLFLQSVRSVYAYLGVTSFVFFISFFPSFSSYTVRIRPSGFFPIRINLDLWILETVPDPLLLRKCGSAGNRTRTSGSVARNSGH
jgi:hypothetical protein